MGTKRPSVFLNDLLTRDTMTLSIKTYLQGIVGVFCLNAG